MQYGIIILLEHIVEGKYSSSGLNTNVVFYICAKLTYHRASHYTHNRDKSIKIELRIKKKNLELLDYRHFGCREGDKCISYAETVVTGHELHADLQYCRKR